MASTRELVFEIGTEEMPAIPLYKATEQMQELVRASLAESGLAFESVECTSTPRRIATFVHGLAEYTEAVHQSMRGPAASIAFDAQGMPTKAASGFARGKGIDPKDLVVREVDGKSYVFAEIDKPARPAAEIVSTILSDAAGKLSWPRSQRWGTHSCRFVRPVRWLLCLFGSEVVPVEFCDLVAGNTTRGHRLLNPDSVTVPDAESYVETLRRAHVIVSAQERADVIRAGIKRIEDSCGLVASTPKHTFDEVVNLVEWPTVVMADFDREFLEVPHEIICESMLSNQRYFPLNDREGNLTQHFLLVSNGDPDRSDVIADGNERVVRARLSDAKFFYEEDLKHPLEEYVPRLAQVGFQERLGSMLDKTVRIERIARSIAEQAGADEATASLAQRAAHLCKADLVTSAVIEFTSQQGVMGGYYAAASGEDPQVSLAISQQYRPRFAGDDLPDQFVGRVVAMADKLDTVCGIFAIDQAPTGSSDPFAVRRASIGVINIVRAEPAIRLASAIEVALDCLENQGISFDRAAIRAAVRAFFVGRLSTIARDEGVSPDTIEALTSVDVVEPVEFLARAHALEDARSHQPELFDDLASAYTRADHLRDASLGDGFDESLAQEQEKALNSSIGVASRQVAQALAGSDYAGAISALASLRGPIDAFFDDVMVMDPDPVIRTNRLRLLNRFIGAFQNVADVGKMEKKESKSARA
jgi:glycyl-tRNA synthetase beta chain